MYRSNCLHLDVSDAVHFNLGTTVFHRRQGYLLFSIRAFVTFRTLISK
jgi:hypothetical protein